MPELESRYATRGIWTDQCTRVGGRSVRVVVIHTMESGETTDTAENVAAYFRTVQASAHYNVDVDSVVQGVPEYDVAWAAPGVNSDGIQIEHAGRADQGTAGWHDAYSKAMLDRSAQLVADICLRNGIPVRHLSDTDLANGAAGIIGHDQASRVYRQSDHTDPGPTFPWAEYMARVSAQYEAQRGGKTTGSTAAPATTTQALGWPVPSTTRITQAFGAMGTSFSVGTGGHTGTDLAVPTGTSVKAIADGTVLWADWAHNLPKTSWADRWFLSGGGPAWISQEGGGGVVVIDHGDYLTVSAHLSQFRVKRGQTVALGQEVALSGATGDAQGPHLHFEVVPKPLTYQTTSSPLKIYGRVDPIAWIKTHTTTRKTAASGGSEQTGDWFDMATEADLERVVERVLKKAINREGAGQSGTTSIWGMAAWMDANLTDLRDRQTSVSRMVRDLWATFRVGIPGVQTDGALGAGVRKVFGYSEKDQSAKRQADYKTAAGKDFQA